MNLSSYKALLPTTSFSIVCSAVSFGYKRSILGDRASFTSTLNQDYGNVLLWYLSIPPISLTTTAATLYFWFHGFKSHTCCLIENCAKLFTPTFNIVENERQDIVSKNKKTTAEQLQNNSVATTVLLCSMNNFNRTDFLLLYNYITIALQHQAPLFARSSYLWFRLGIISCSHLHCSRPCVWSLFFCLPLCCTLLHMEVPQVSHFIYTWMKGQLLFSTSSSTSPLTLDSPYTHGRRFWFTECLNFHIGI